MLHIDIGRCTGCQRCEVACSFFHTGRVSRHLSRIKVLNLYETGVDFPAACVQCKERFCLSCPQNALSIGAYGQVVVSPTRCNLCGACEVNCPIGAMEIFKGFVYVCDLCGGSPKCVEACTEGAITWLKKSVETVSLAALKEKTKRKSPNQKREIYAELKGRNLQRIWKVKND